MPYRINQNNIIQILDFDPSITNLTPFIAAAEQLVDRVVANTNFDTTGSSAYIANPIQYSAQELVNIESWLAAHFVAIRDPRYASNSMGPTSQSYVVQGGMNLGQTPYGQQAMLLDINGGLAWLDQHISRGSRAKVGITYLGTNQRQAWYYGYPWRFYALGTG
jgi:hypothetical protein